MRLMPMKRTDRLGATSPGTPGWNRPTTPCFFSPVRRSRILELPLPVSGTLSEGTSGRPRQSSRRRLRSQAPTPITSISADYLQQTGTLSGTELIYELPALIPQLKERIAQLQEQIDGLELQASAKADEILLIQDELTGVEQLWRKNLVPITRVTALRREETRLRGERGQLISNVAQAKGRISETLLQIIQIDQDLRSEVSKELREIQAKASELVERKTAAEDQLKRIEIRAPQDGIVLESKVHTVGGVIPAGDAIMLIVPESDNLLVEAKVNPHDIDQVQVGQSAVLRFSAFNLRTTPEINGTITRISADTTTDQRTGQNYYTTRIAMTKDEIARLGDVKLIPGMPVEAFVQTGERTVMSYLIKPLQDQFMRTFREK